MDGQDSEARARGLLESWRAVVRPALEDHLQGEIVALDQAAQLLERALAVKTELAIGFVGEAQVGKSSLINALVERSALPSGGIGPLTAQATRVSFSDEDRMIVAYHGQDRLRGVRLSIEKALVRKGELPPAEIEGDAALNSERVDQLADVSVAQSSAPSPATQAPEPETEDAITARDEQERRFQYLLDQIWSMLSGVTPSSGEAEGRSGRPEASVLADGLRAILSERPRRPDTLVPYRPQIEKVQRYLGVTETVTAASGGGTFDDGLRIRAAGWLAPLVRELSVHLRSNLIRRMSFVDLPGIGVQADPGALVAERFVAAGGDALVVVMRNSGLTDIVARLLERTGVIHRLLMDGDVAHSIHIVVVVTHLDDVARTRWQEAARASRAAGQRPPDAHQVFRDLGAQMVTKVREQIRHALHTSTAEDLTGGQKERRAHRIEQLCEAMDVICVAAPDYLSIVEGFADMAFLKDRDSTNIPDLRRRLEAVSERHRAHRSRLIFDAARELCSQAGFHLRAISTAYEEGRGAAHTQWESFRVDLEKDKLRLREDMKASHGELLAQLQNTLPAEIRVLCHEAESGALRKLNGLRRQGDGLHYQSLNAALNRDGIWDRKSINYPEALTLKFVETIALDWDSRVIDGIRGAIRKMVDRDLQLVERLCQRAQELDSRIVGDAQIVAQKQILQQQARTCVAWTRERLEELTGNVRGELSKSIGDVMQSACEKARKAGENRGQGAKKHILEAFERGGTVAAGKARERAVKVLSDHYESLLNELRTGFLAEHHDPVEDAFNRLTDDKLLRARRSDARKRAAVRDQVARSITALTTSRFDERAVEAQRT